mmetsp:Transcript_39528/g.112875  ORF Transcript_39528/g.112875 Transcript_39528/m.112875 type:complete len:224 (+) Transcript_39528:1684-2355(+)
MLAHVALRVKLAVGQRKENGRGRLPVQGRGRQLDRRGHRGLGVQPLQPPPRPGQPGPAPLGELAAGLLCALSQVHGDCTGGLGDGHRCLRSDCRRRRLRRAPAGELPLELLQDMQGRDLWALVPWHCQLQQRGRLFGRLLGPDRQVLRPKLCSHPAVVGPNSRHLPVVKAVASNLNLGKACSSAYALVIGLGRCRLPGPDHNASLLGAADYLPQLPLAHGACL